MRRLLLVLCMVLVLLLLLLGLYRLGILPQPAFIQENAAAFHRPRSPAPATKPTPQPESEPKPAPEPPPELHMEVGAPRLVNGMRLETSVVDETQYVSAEELAAAMRLKCSVDGVCAQLTGLPGATAFYAGDCNAMADGCAVLLCRAPIEDNGTLYLPLDDSARALGCSAYFDDQAGTQYLTSGGGDWVIPENVNIPILEYHAVSNNLWGIPELFVDPANMEAQLAYLVDNGYDTLFFEDLRHVEQYDKPVLLTFDDGYDDNYLELLPLLQKYQAKATCFVVAGFIGGNHSMTADQIRTMAESGLVSIQSHGMTHHFLGQMNEEQLRYEFSESKRILAELTGAEPYVLCYPSGNYSALTLSIGREYFKFGVKMNGRLYNTSDDPFLAGRYYVSRYDTLEQVAAMLNEA